MPCLVDGSLLAWVKWPEDSGSGESIDTYSEGSEASDQLSLSGGEQRTYVRTCVHTYMYVSMNPTRASARVHAHVCMF